MDYFDLSVPYIEKSGVADSCGRSRSHLQTAARLMELGYTAIAYDRPFRGVLSDDDRCRIAPFPTSSLLDAVTGASSGAFAASVALHRELLGVPRSSPFRQYTRITVSVESAAAASALCGGNRLLRSYDIVAVRPVNQMAFDQACQASNVDIIALDFSQRVPFRLKSAMVKDAVKRGVHFEITYAHLIANGHASLQKSSHPKRGVQEISHVTDDHARRHTLSDAKLLADWTRGKNLIISGSAASLKEVRGPNDVANLVCFLLGLSMERAKAAISGNCRLLVANALRKKDCYFMGAIRIERMLPEEQVDAQEDWFKDWNVWDPISNGKGDFLSLDEMARLFSTASTRSKCQNAINSTSSINGVVPNAPLFSCTNQNLPDYATEIPSSNEVDHYDMVGNLAVKNSKSMIRKFVETAASEDDKPYSNETEMSDNVGRNSSVARTSISAGLLSVTDFSIMDFTHADKINASNVERREVITAQVDADSVLLKFPSGVAEDMDCSSVDTENQISMMNKETMVTVSLQNDAFTEQFLEAGSKTVQRDENSNQYNRCLHEDLYKHPSICESNVLSSSTDVSFNYFPNKMENPEVVPLETSTSNLNGNVGCTNQGRRKYDSTSAVASTKVDLADGSIDSEILGTGGVLLNTSTSSGFTSEAKSKKKRNTASEISLAGKTRRRRKSCHRPYLLTFKSLCKPMFVKKKAWRLRKAKLL